MARNQTPRGWLAGAAAVLALRAGGQGRLLALQIPIHPSIHPAPSPIRIPRKTAGNMLRLLLYYTVLAWPGLECRRAYFSKSAECMLFRHA